MFGFQDHMKILKNAGKKQEVKLKNHGINLKNIIGSAIIVVSHLKHSKTLYLLVKKRENLII